MRLIEVLELGEYKRFVSIDWIAEVQEAKGLRGEGMCRLTLKNGNVCTVASNIRGLFEMIQSAEEL